MEAKIFLLLLLVNYGFGTPTTPLVSHLEKKSTSVADYIMEAIPKGATQMIEELSDYASDYCHTIGHVGLPKDPEHIDVAIVHSTSLLPSPFPAELFLKAKEVQPFVNELYFRVSMDPKFLYDAYKDMLGADVWIKRQVELMLSVQERGIRQPKTLIFNRADYLTHQVEKGGQIGLKQVEVGIGQLGGPGFGQKSSELHKKMLEKVEIMHYGKPATLAQGKVPENDVCREAGKSMYLAWKAYMNEHEKDEPGLKAVVVFLFEAKVIEVAYFEQTQFMQFELERVAKEHGDYVNVVRVTIPESPDRIKLNEKNGHLYLDGDKRVALVHMVVGLLPHHWKGEEVWKTRFDMEVSSAILSPNIRAQLAGTKRIQQLLAQPENLKRFFGPNEKNKIEALHETFVGLWGLENNDPATKAIIEKAITHPDKYVLKAQLGSGKGNYFGEELKEKLEKMNATQRSAYTLMQRIHPIVVKNYMRKQLKMVPGDLNIKEQPKPIATSEEVNSELSIFGTYLGDGDFNNENADPEGEMNNGERKVPKKHHHSQNHREIFNRTDGYFVRGKLSTSDQGGISEGFGFFDSLLLFPEETLRHWN